MTSGPIRFALPALLALAGPGLAQEPFPAAPARLVVLGRGSVEAVPDLATVSIGVQARAPTAAAAIDETSAAARKVVDAARAFGIAPRDIATGSVALQPVYRARTEPGSGSPQPDGVQATNDVQVRIRDLARLGEFLRRGVGDGANRIGGLSFGVADRTPLRREAQAAAIRDARDGAEAMAAAAGLALGPIRLIRAAPRSGEGPGRPLPMQALRAAAPEVPVEPGSLEVSAEVEVTWELRQP